MATRSNSKQGLQKSGARVSAPRQDLDSLVDLESVTKRELNQSRRPDRTGDRPEIPAFYVRESGVAKVGVIPNVEEIGREPQFLPLSELKVLHQREVPVLLSRPAECVASKISETRCAEVGVGEALRRIQLGRKIERVAIQVAVDSCTDVAAGVSTRHRGPSSKICGQHARSRSRTQECSSGARIEYRERQSRLNDGNAADRPSRQRRMLPALLGLKERQFVAVAYSQAMRAVEVGKTSRIIQVGFIVERSIERGVASGSCIRRSGECVSGLEIARSPAARQRGLKRVVVRVGIVGEELEPGVAVDALCTRTSHGVSERVGRDRVAVENDGIGWSRVLRLQRVARFTQVNRVSTHVTDLKHPLPSKGMLHG